MRTSGLARTFVLASWLGTAVVGGVAVDAVAPREAEAFDESQFYVSLSSHGHWIQNAQFGWVWYPRYRPAGWRPYTVGRWAWTDYGEWMWLSDEPWGWATYHYGRWFLDPFYGWVWIPGRVWAPAWVTWRYSDNYIGWAPLGPYGYWSVGFGWRGWYDRYRYYDYHRHYDRYHDHDRYDRDHDRDRDDHDYRRGGRGDDRYTRGDDRDGRGRGGYNDENYWTFTRARDFTSPRVDKVAVDRRHLPEVMRRTREVAPPSQDAEKQGRGINRAIDKSFVERASGRPIRPLKVEETAALPSSGKAALRGDRVRVYRPPVEEAKPGRTPDKLGIATFGDRGERPSREAPGGVRGPRDDGPGRGGSDVREQPGRGDRGGDRTGIDRGPTQEREQPGRGNRGDDRSSIDRGRKPDAGAYERPARPDELGGYERPARPDEREGYERIRPVEPSQRGREPSAGTSPGKGVPRTQERVRQPERATESRVQPSRPGTPRVQPSRPAPPSPQMRAPASPGRGTTRPEPSSPRTPPSRSELRVQPSRPQAQTQSPPKVESSPPSRPQVPSAPPPSPARSYGPAPAPVQQAPAGAGGGPSYGGGRSYGGGSPSGGGGGRSYGGGPPSGGGGGGRGSAGGGHGGGR